MTPPPASSSSSSAGLWLAEVEDDISTRTTFTCGRNGGEGRIMNGVGRKNSSGAFSHLRKKSASLRGSGVAAFLVDYFFLLYGNLMRAHNRIFVTYLLRTFSSHLLDHPDVGGVRQPDRHLDLALLLLLLLLRLGLGLLLLFVSSVG